LYHCRINADAAFLVGVVMRKLVPLLFATLAASTAAHAYDATSCRTEATAAADEWARGNIVSASEAALVEPAPLVIISYGHKYGAARNAMDAETLRPRALGTLATQRNLVYKEELDRCLGHFTVKIVGVDPGALKRLTAKRPGQN
jgi:hypothetical protein